MSARPAEAGAGLAPAPGQGGCTSLSACDAAGTDAANAIRPVPDIFMPGGVMQARQPKDQLVFAAGAPAGGETPASIPEMTGDAMMHRPVTPALPEPFRDVLVRLGRPGAFLWCGGTPVVCGVFSREAGEPALVRRVKLSELSWLTAVGALVPGRAGRLGRCYTLSARGAAMLADPAPVPA